MKQTRLKTCPRCQAKFDCGLAQGHETCWCFDCPRVLPVVENAACLCPDCLRNEIATRTSEFWTIISKEEPRTKEAVETLK